MRRTFNSARALTFNLHETLVASGETAREIRASREIGAILAGRKHRKHGELKREADKKRRGESRSKRSGDEDDDGDGKKPVSIAMERGRG